MDFEKVENFIRLHWPAAVIVSAITVPSIWAMASMHYKERMTTLELKVEGLEGRLERMDEELTVLREYKDRSSTISEVRLGFEPESLFTPSKPLIEER